LRARLGPFGFCSVFKEHSASLEATYLFYQELYYLSTLEKQQNSPDKKAFRQALQQHYT
jgi:hypothetical protein